MATTTEMGSLRSSVTLLISICLVSTSPRLMAKERVNLSGSTMGTTYSVKLHSAPSDLRKPELQSQIDSRLQTINGLLSTYLDDSEVSRFNRTAADEWFPVSTETLQVVEMAQQVSAQTDGAFDITVAPLVRLWNFGAGSTSGFQVPAVEQVTSVQESVGYQNLTVRRDPPALKKSVSSLEIDLSGIAKGFAVDEVAALLLAQKIDQFMIEIGGEVRVAGERDDGRPWNIGIESPKKTIRELKSVYGIVNSAIASSGDYRNFHEHQGKFYSHTIDPRTGAPVEHRLAAVSVVSETCAEADAMATALLVMGPKGLKWAETSQVAALFLTRDQASIIESTTSYFDEAALSARNAEPASSDNSTFAKLAMASLIVFGIALLGMSAGVILSNRRLQGSCGGLANVKDENGITACDLCRNPSPECSGENQAEPENSADSGNRADFGNRPENGKTAKASAKVDE